jgi:hypothetical protein
MRSTKKPADPPGFSILRAGLPLVNPIGHAGAFWPWIRKAAAIFGVTTRFRPRDRLQAHPGRTRETPGPSASVISAPSRIPGSSRVLTGHGRTDGQRGRG